MEPLPSYKMVQYMFAAAFYLYLSLQKYSNKNQAQQHNLVDIFYKKMLSRQNTSLFDNGHI